MWNCSRSVNSDTTWLGAPLASWRRRLALARMISASLCVRSSSERLEESTDTEGRTLGGGTGSTVSTIQSGRACVGLRPSARQSSSEIWRKMSCTRSAVITCFRSPTSGISSSSSLRLRSRYSALILPASMRKLGCGWFVSGHDCFVLHASTKRRSRAFGLRMRSSSRYLGSSCGPRRRA